MKSLKIKSMLSPHLNWPLCQSSWVNRKLWSTNDSQWEIMQF